MDVLGSSSQSDTGVVEAQRDFLEDSRLPGSPLFMDRLMTPQSANATLPSSLPSLDGTTPAAHRSASTGPTDVVASDGEFVYLMTSQQNPVHLIDVIAVPLSEHNASDQGGESSRRDTAGNDQAQPGVGEPVADTVRSAGLSKVVLELVRRVWIASDGDIDKERGEQADELATCPICLEPMFSGDTVVTSCSHCYHIGCCRQSERVSISTSGFWSCPSCRETITTIRARLMQDTQVTADLDTAPCTDNSRNLTYVLRRNPAMQSVVRNMLLLEDYVVGSRRNCTTGDATAGCNGGASARIAGAQPGFVSKYAAHVSGCFEADGQHPPPNAKVEQNTGGEVAAERVGEDEAGALAGAIPAGGTNLKLSKDLGTVTVMILPGEGIGESGLDLEGLQGSHATHSKCSNMSLGQPGLLSATVEMKYLLDGTSDGAGPQDDELLSAQLLFLESSEQLSMRSRRQRRQYVLGFMAFIVIKIIFVIVLWMMGNP